MTKPYFIKISHLYSLTHIAHTHATDFLTGLLASVIAVDVFSFKSPPPYNPSYLSLTVSELR